MMVAAADALGSFDQEDIVNAVDNNIPPLLPPIENMRDIAIHIAVKVGLQAQHNRVAPEMSESELRKQIRQRFWIPEYRNYRRHSNGLSRAT